MALRPLIRKRKRPQKIAIKSLSEKIVIKNATGNCHKKIRATKLKLPCKMLTAQKKSVVENKQPKHKSTNNSQTNQFFQKKNQFITLKKNYVRLGFESQTIRGKG